VKGVKFGETIADQIQREIDSIDASKLAQELASSTAQTDAAAAAKEHQALLDAVDAARLAREKLAETTPGLSGGLAKLRTWQAEAAKADQAIRDAEAALTEYEARAKQTRATNTLDARRAALEAQLAAQQAVDSAYAAAASAAQSVDEATRSLNEALANIPRVAQQSMLDAMHNLSGLAGQLGDSIGQYLDQHLADQIESLSHSKTARAISALDKRLREEGEKSARDSARRGIADARKQLKQQTGAVKDAQAELAKILREGPKKGTPGKVSRSGTAGTSGTSLREQAYSRVIFPEDEAIPGTPGSSTVSRSGGTKGETQAEFQKRVSEAKKAVQSAQDARTSAIQSVKDQENALHTLLLQQQRDRLARALAARQQELEDEEAATKKSVARQLSDLSELYNRHLIGLPEFQKRLQKIVGNDVGVWKQIASSLGMAAADEFWAVLKGLGHQAVAIAEGPLSAVAGRTGHEKTIALPANAVKNAIDAAEAAKKERDNRMLAWAESSNKYLATVAAAHEAWLKAHPAPSATSKARR
jgi:hypothetical protein